MIRRLIPALLAAALVTVIPMSAGLSAAMAAPAVGLGSSPPAATKTAPCPPGAQTFCDGVESWLIKNPDKAKKLGDVPGVKQIGSLGDAVGKLGDAARKLSKFSPSDITEMWAKKAGQMAVGLMGKISDFQKRVSKPGWDAKWWTKEYALMAGLGFIVFAFVLVIVTAKISRSRGEDSISGIALLRSAGIRLWMVPAIIVGAPALLMEIFGVTAGLAGVFAKQSTGSAGAAMDAGMDAIGNMQNTMANVGGALGAIVIAALIGVAALVVLTLLMLATWGLNVLALFLPVVLAMYVYPPWRPATKKLAGIMLGLLLMPTFVNIIYWVFWAASKEAINGATGDVFGVVMFMVVGAVMMAAAPLIAAWLIPMVVPEGGSMAGGLGGGAVGGLAGSLAGSAGSRAIGSGAARASRLATHSRNRPSPAEVAATAPPAGGASQPATASGGGPGGASRRGGGVQDFGQSGSSASGQSNASTTDQQTTPSPTSGGAARRAGAKVKSGAGQAARRGSRAALGAGRRVKDGSRASTRDMVDRNPFDWSEDR